MKLPIVLTGAFRSEWLFSCIVWPYLLMIFACPSFVCLSRCATCRTLFLDLATYDILVSGLSADFLDQILCMEMSSGVTCPQSVAAKSFWCCGVISPGVETLVIEPGARGTATSVSSLIKLVSIWMGWFCSDLWTVSIRSAVVCKVF